MGWVPAGDYEVALDEGKVVCRNTAGPAAEVRAAQDRR